MAAEREGLMAPETSKTREDSLRDLFAWVQEHASFCSVVASLGATDPFVLATLEPKLKASLERGRQLLDACALESKTSSEAAAYISGALPSGAALDANWASGSRLTAPRRQPLMPLSGMNRFTEDSASRTAGFRPIHRPESALSSAKAPNEAMGPLGQNPIGHTSSVISAPSRNPPLPSRTYLKKSGS